MNYGYSKNYPKHDKAKKWRKQRKKRGFDDTELASLDTSLARHIYPRLLAFRDYTKSYPMGMTEEQWNEILDKMLFSFKIIMDEEYFDLPAEDTETHKILQQGFELFGKYYQHLWS